MGPTKSLTFSRVFPKGCHEMRSYDCIYRGYMFSFSIYKATNRGERTSFITIGSGPILKGFWCFFLGHDSEG